MIVAECQNADYSMSLGHTDQYLRAMADIGSLQVIILMTLHSKFLLTHPNFEVIPTKFCVKHKLGHMAVMVSDSTANLNVQELVQLAIEKKQTSKLCIIGPL